VSGAGDVVKSMSAAEADIVPAASMAAATAVVEKNLVMIAPVV
jgi:hypothetical protein